MADAAIPMLTAASSAAPSVSQVVNSLAGTITIYGFTFNLMGLAIAVLIFSIFFLFYRIQKSEKLDFADMITKDGRSVSLTKILQLIGGMTATWIMIKLTLTGGLTDILFGIYLSYVAGVEGYSKFVSAKYGYKEGSVKDAKALSTDDEEVKPPKD
jgi:hypothetical protein